MKAYFISRRCILKTLSTGVVRSKIVGLVCGVVCFAGASSLASAQAVKVSSLEKPRFEKIKLKGKKKVTSVSLQAGHSGHVTDLDISADGKIMVTASGLSDGLVKVWDVDSGAVLHTLDSEDSVSISPDGKLVAAGNIGGPIKVWSIDTGKLIKELKGSGPVVFAQNGEVLIGEAMPGAGVSEGTVEVWNTKDWTSTKLGQGHEASLSAIAVSGNGDVVITGGYDDSIKIWGAKTGELLATFKDKIKTPSALAVSKDLKWFAVSYQGKGAEVELWSMDKRSVSKRLKTKGNVTGLAFSPDGATLATATTEEVTQLWGMDGASKGDVAGGGEVVFMPDSAKMMHGRRALTLTDVNTKQELKAFAPNDTRIFQTAFSRDGKYVLTSDAKSAVGVWDIKQGGLVASFHIDNGTEGAPEGELLLSPSGDMVVLRPFVGDTLRVFSIKGKVLEKPFKTVKVEGLREIRGVSFAPNGKQIVIESAGDGGDGTQLVWWDLEGGKKLNATKFSGYVSVDGFVDGGKQVALVSTGTGRGAAQLSLKLWSGETGLMKSVKVKDIPPFGGDIDLANEGSLVALGDADNSVKVWDRTEEKIVQTLSGHDELVNVVAFSPDARLLATGSWDEAVRIWDVKSGKELLALKGNYYQAQHISFSPHDDVVAISYQGWLKLIHLPTGRTREVYYDEHDGNVNWLVYDGSGHFECVRTGCDMIKYRLDNGELVSGTDEQVKKLRGVEKFGR